MSTQTDRFSIKVSKFGTLDTFQSTMLRLTFLCVLCTFLYGAQADVPLGKVPPMRLIPKLYVTRDFGTSCISSCFNSPPVTPAVDAMQCVQECVEALVHSIEDWLEDLPNVPNMRTHDTRAAYNKLYVDGSNLQQQLLALQRATQRPGGILDALFPNFPSFGIFRPPNNNMQQGFASRPQFPGLILQVIQTITKLLAQVIQKQQEVLQAIIGCSCNGTMSTTTTTMAPITSPGSPTTITGSTTTTASGSTTTTAPTTGTTPTTISAGR